jgi:leader peptidase (prepilin peptidase)/N-methyltransferase
VTITDLLDYIVPDIVVAAGVLIAVTSASLSGELQMIHVWVDWNSQWVALHGPYLPEWMKHHQHLHGFVWSMAGLLTGAGLMWLLRWLASTILGYPAVGLGDVTLMAMIGAFLGWQPTLCTLAIAPMVGLVLGLGIRLTQGRSFVAFGPYLTSAAVLVLCSWRWLWVDFNLRTLFGHWPTIAALVGGAFLAISLSLGLLRIYRAIPADAIRR